MKLPKKLIIRSPIAQFMNVVNKPSVVRAKRGKGSYKRKQRNTRDTEK